MEQERVMEQDLDFVMLSPTVEHAVTKAARVHAPSTEEQDMWDNHALFPDHFDAGIDRTAAAVHERKRLEREATDFDLWRGVDFVLEEDPNNGQLLLEELEEDDMLTELLRNARMYTIPLRSQFSISYHVFGQI